MKTIYNLIFFFILITNSVSLICDNKICDEIGGICISNDLCNCKEMFTTYPTHYDYKYCNYEKKRKITTAFLELLVGFGTGHFYCGRIVNGSFKLIIYIILCCLSFCTIAMVAKLTEDGRENYINSIHFFLNIYGLIVNIILIWQIYDFLMFLTGVYNDGNNISLY
jgi:hypothetical protein